MIPQQLCQEGYVMPSIYSWICL